MDLIVRLALPDSTLTIGGLDLQLEPAIMAWNPIPRPPLNRSRLLLLRSRRVQDRSRKSSNLRQSGPSVRGHNLTLLLKENLSPWHGVSFLLILTGVILVNRQQKKHELGKR